MRKKILWITETAVMLALLVAVQGITAGLGNQFITGSCVNLVLAVTALMVGLWGGVAVAAVSPFVAFLLGIGQGLGFVAEFLVIAKERFPGRNQNRTGIALAFQNFVGFPEKPAGQTPALMAL